VSLFSFTLLGWDAGWNEQRQLEPDFQLLLMQPAVNHPHYLSITIPGTTPSTAFDHASLHFTRMLHARQAMDLLIRSDALPDLTGAFDETGKTGKRVTERSIPPPCPA
jgi:hypothetical protein